MAIEVLDEIMYIGNADVTDEIFQAQGSVTNSIFDIKDEKSINKVVYDGKTLIDLTDDTVNAESLAAGFTAHKSNGNVVHGQAEAALNGLMSDGSAKGFAINGSAKQIRPYLFYSMSEIENLTIPMSAKYIGEHAFDGCSSIQELYIPSAENGIGPYAFSGCSNLERLILTKNFKNPDKQAFANFNGTVCFEEGTDKISFTLFQENETLKKVELPTTCTNIETNAFFECVSLEEVHRSNIGEAQPMSIGTHAFENCTSLSYFDFDKVISIDQYAFMHCNFSSIVLNDVQDIKGSVFSYNENLISVEINSQLKDLYGAFQGCISLENVKLPESLEYISSAFLDCSSLRTIIIPKNVRTIGPQCFMNDTLLDIYLPKSLEVIETEAFVGATVGNVYYEGSEADWEAIAIGIRNEALQNANIIYNYVY